MKYILQSLIFLFCSIAAWGQKNASVTGTLVENSDTKDPVEQVTVRLLSLPDSVMVTGTTSNKNGIFTLQNIHPGKYVLHISYVGYKHLYKPVSVDGKTTTVNLGVLSLSPDDILLQEAVVTGKAAEVVVKGDTLEFNADSYKTQENAVVEDVLKKLPGVEVDNDGKITVGGKEVKKILVEGKEFFSDDPKVASKNLPANMIDKLQVLDRKSDMGQITGFNDGEEETVINLTVKPGMKKGIIGNTAAGYGQDINSEGASRYEIAGMLNQMANNDRYTLMFNANNTNNMGASDMGGTRFGGMRGMRRGGNNGINQSETFAINLNKEFSPRLTLNGDISYNGSNRNSNGNTQRTTTYKTDKNNPTDKSLIESTRSRNNDISDNFGANFRMEWKPDSNNTIIFRPNFSYNKSNSTQNQLLESLDGLSMDTLNTGRSLSYNEGEGYNLGGTIEYAHQFSKPGRILSFSLRGGYNSSYSEENYDWSRSIYENNIHDRDSLVNKRSENDYKNTSYRIQVSYVEPLGKNYFMQLSYRLNQSGTKDINSAYWLDSYDRDNLFGNPVDTLTLIPQDSRSTIRKATEQRFSLNIKSVHEKFNYSIGLNVDPSRTLNETYQPNASTVSPIYRTFPYEDRLPNIQGDSLISSIPQNVVNFSPEINFNYNFGKRTNLRVDYSGTTIQPTARQLQDFTDTSNPTNSITGNPNLKPGYQNDFSARFNKFIPESQLFYNLQMGGNLTLNNISSVVIINDKGLRSTTYENVNGNWNINIRGGMNTPLRNKKFTVGSFLGSNYQNRRSYTNGSLNTMKTFTIRDASNINYRSTLFDIGFNASFAYANSINEAQPDKNQQTYDLGLGGNTSWYLPHHLTIDSDISWNGKRGYSEGFNKNETIWNAAVTKQVFNKKAGTGSIRLKIFDILQQRKSISRSVGDNYIEDTQSNTLQSFFMASFIYRFSIFPKGSSATEQDMQPERRWRGGGPPSR